MPPLLIGRRRRHAPLVVVLLLAAVAVGGCGRTAFDPSGPCSVDGRSAGAYPNLEALLPTRFRDRIPDKVDSGRNCSDTALGSLKSHGVVELHFAGATWSLGPHGGVTFAVLDAANLDPAWVQEFYRTGAESARNVQSVTSSTTDWGAGVLGQRIDVLNGESYQTIVSWPKGSRVAVVLVASFIREIQTKDAHNAIVDDALRTAQPG